MNDRQCYFEPVTYGLVVRQASYKVLPTELRGEFHQNLDEKKPCLSRRFSCLAPSTGLEPVTYGLVVRQASHKVPPTELRGNFIKI